MDQATVTGEAPAHPYLSAADITAAFQALTPADMLKLEAIERLRLRGTGLAKGDLIHEAVCRAILGERKCPQGTVFMAFLVQTIRSLASHARAKRRRGIIAETASSHEAATNRNPEDELIDHQTVGALYEHFDDDSEAQSVLLGLADGLAGAELREQTGLDQGALDYAKKRIRTKIRKLYPQGWIP